MSDISQGSVATHLRCGGLLTGGYYTLMAQSHVYMAKSAYINRTPICAVGRS